MNDCGHLALVASGEGRGLCVLCQRAEIERLQAQVTSSSGYEFVFVSTMEEMSQGLTRRHNEIEELKAQRERLLAVLNKGMTLVDHLMGELTHQTGRKPPFAVVLAKREFDAAMEALLS